jgi:hypothetical protein
MSCLRHLAQSIIDAKQIHDPGYSVALCRKRRYNSSDRNSPALTRVRIRIFGRTDGTVRMSLPPFVVEAFAAASTATTLPI